MSTPPGGKDQPRDALASEFEFYKKGIAELCRRHSRRGCIGICRAARARGGTSALLGMQVPISERCAGNFYRALLKSEFTLLEYMRGREVHAVFIKILRNIKCVGSLSIRACILS